VPMDESMIDISSARTLASQEVDEVARRSGLDLALDDHTTRDEGWCWLFFYNTREYVETRNVGDALAGNGPILVEKASGNLRHLVAARPIEEQLAELHRRRD